MDIDAAEAARSLLMAAPPDLHPVGRLWRINAAAHLASGIDAYLRGGALRITGEDQAIALLKVAARDLRESADALHAAAVAFRSAGQGFSANRAYHAAAAAARAAEALDPR